MYELVRVGERTFFIDCPSKIGVYLQSDRDVFLIDSGNDRSAGRRVRRLLDENGWTLRGILNTHSNADHIGGNRYLQQHGGCKVFAGGMEAAFTEYTSLGPALLYGGYPFADLRHKLLMAEPSRVSAFSDPDFPSEIEVIPLPGHFLDMAGFRTPDHVVFLADCLSSPAALAKYGISFIYDVAAYLETLYRVSSMEAEWFVPSHAEAARDIRPLAELNRDKVHEVAGHILSACAAPVMFEPLLQGLFSDFGLTMTFEQYVLVGSTVRSYLSWLKDQGKVEARIENNCLLWQAVPAH